MMVYTRPKYIKNCNDFPKESRTWALRRAIWGSKVEPKHSLLGAIDIRHDSKGNKILHQALGKDMISSLTTGSGEDKGPDCVIRTYRRWSTPADLDVISEVPERTEDPESKRDENRDRMPMDKESTDGSERSCSAIILMDGSIRESTVQNPPNKKPS